MIFKPESGISVSKIQESSFIVTVTNRFEHVETVEHFVATAHNIISAFVMSLNIATLGHFVWASGRGTYLPYELIDPYCENTSKRLLVAFNSKSKTWGIDLSNITREEVRRAALLFIALAKEMDSNVRREYIKGIIHLSLDVHDISFHKEAFANFYRSLEFLVTERVLKVKKLKNELKQIQDAIQSLGFQSDLVEEFESLYKLRGDQVMHAQKKQNEIERDDAYKMKVLLDAMLYKIYQPVWNSILRDQVMPDK